MKHRVHSVSRSEGWNESYQKFLVDHIRHHRHLYSSYYDRLEGRDFCELRAAGVWKWNDDWTTERNLHYLYKLGRDLDILRMTFEEFSILPKRRNVVPAYYGWRWRLRNKRDPWAFYRVLVGYTRIATHKKKTQKRVRWKTEKPTYWHRNINFWKRRAAKRHRAWERDLIADNNWDELVNYKSYKVFADPWEWD